MAGVVLVAADFWEKKDFTTWSDQEVEKMLEDSPWSREVTIRLGSMRGGRGGNDADGGGRSRGRGGGVGIGRGRQGIGGENSGYGPAGQTRRIESRPHNAALPRRLELTVSWRSALPFKKALVRAGVGANVDPPPEQQQFLAKVETFYVVTVGGFPKRFAELAERHVLRPESVLKPENMDPIVAADIRVALYEDTVVVLCFFPKTNPITLDNKNVVFTAQVGRIEVEKKFKLKDMVFEGQLSL